MIDYTADNHFRKIKVLSVRGLNAIARGIRFAFVDKCDAESFSFVPGSFIMVGIPGFGESPLTITTSPSELPEFEIAVRSAGNNTIALNRLQPGDTAYLRGPLGNSINLSKIYGRELLLIGGGIGIAPLRSFIRTAGEDSKLYAKLAIVYGAKSPEDLVFKDDFAKWEKFAELKLVVDKADPEWTGEVGRIPDAVKKLEIAKDATAIICGPPVMYESLAKVLTEKGLSADNINFMLERRMKCGIGKCQHCTCGEKYVCIDGPTFTLAEITNNWEALR